MILGCPIFLLFLLHGAFGDLFKLNCSNLSYQCGDNAIITCGLNFPFLNFTIIHDDKTLIEKHLDGEENLSTENGRISIEWTEDKMKLMITLSNIKISDRIQYKLFVDSESGHDVCIIPSKVSGICKPNISENEVTKELECEVESGEEVSIVWIDINHTVYKATKLEKFYLNFGYKFRSSLKLTDEMRGTAVKCSVSSVQRSVSKEDSEWYPPKPSDAPIPEELKGSNSKNSTLPIVMVFLVVALFAAALGYLLKRRNLAVLRAAQGVLVSQDDIPDDVKTVN